MVIGEKGSKTWQGKHRLNRVLTFGRRLASFPNHPSPSLPFFLSSSRVIKKTPFTLQIRRGSWRQSSGRASPAPGSGGQGQGQGQGPRSARSGSQVDQQVEGSITSVENGSGEVVS